MMPSGLEPRPSDLLLHQVHTWNGWLIMGLPSVLLVLRIWTLLAVVVAHAGAALWHHFWRRDETPRRMIRHAP
jgi:cytochrome b561